MSFTARCGNCASTYEAEDDWLGQEAECPSCGAAITIERSISAAELAYDDVPAEEQEVCPHCQSPLAVANAVICIECGTNLQTGAAATANSQASSAPPKSLLLKIREQLYLLGYAFAGLGTISVVLNLIGYNLKFLMWIDHWGDGAGWIIRLTAIVAGGRADGRRAQTTRRWYRRGPRTESTSIFRSECWGIGQGGIHS